MPKDKPAPTSRLTAEHPNLDEEIRVRAFAMYEARGCEDGHDLEDWLHAEAEVPGTAVKAKAA
jgi:DUF2934 family protein